MLLKKIKYSQLFSFGQFQNETIGLEAELELGEDPKKAMRLLKVQVINMHEYNQEIRDINLEIRQLHKQIDMDKFVIADSEEKTLDTDEQRYYESIIEREQENTDKIEKLTKKLNKLMTEYD